MAKTRRITGVLGVCILAAGVLLTVGSSTATAQTFGYDNLNDIQKRHVSGLLGTELGAQAPARSAAPTRPAVTVPQRPGPNADFRTTSWPQD